MGLSFSLASFAALAMAAVGVLALQHRTMVDGIHTFARDHNMELAKSLAIALDPNIHQLIDARSGASFAPPDFQAMESRVMLFIEGVPILKLNVIALDGSILYSTDPGDIGERETNPAFMAAAGGKVGSLANKHGPLRRFDEEIEPRNLLESYIPVRHDGRIEAVFEIYYDLEPMLAEARRTTARLGLIVTLMFIVLWVVLFAIMRYATRLLESNTRRNLQLAAAIDSATTGVAVTDATAPEGAVIFANPAFSEMTGRAEGSRGMDDMFRMIDSNHPGSNAVHQAFREKTGVAAEVEFRREDGAVAPCQITVEPVRDEEGNVVAFVTLLTDVTDLRSAQEVLRRTQHELEAAEAVKTLQSEFLSDMSRELRMPLNTILGYAQMLTTNLPKPLPPSQQREYVGLIEQAARDLLGIVTASLDVLRIQSSLQPHTTGYRQLVEMSPDLICVTRDGEIQLINEVGASLLGSWSANVMVGQRFSDHVHGDDQILVENDFERMLFRGPRSTLKLVRDDGEGIFVDATARAVEFEGASAVMIVARDITQSVRRERELLKLSQAVEQSPVSIMITDLGGRIEYVNRHFVNTTGYQLSEVLGRTPRFLNSGERSADEYERMMENMRSGKGWRGELRNRRKDGALYWEDLNTTPVRDESGRVLNFLGVAEDVTERKESERTIRDLAKFPDQDPSPVMRVSTGGELLYANESCKPLLKAWAAVGKAVPDHIVDFATRAFELGEADEVEATYGETVYSMMFAPVPEAGYVNIYCRDITKARSTESQLRHAHKMEAIGTLAGGIAHDFNNILGAIIGYAHLIRDEVDDDGQARSDLDNILAAANRAKNLVGHILTFSRRREAERHAVEVPVIVKEVLELIRASIPASIELRTDIKAQKATVMADATRIHQLLMNLCSNAADAIGDAPGVIRVAVEETAVGPDDQLAFAGGLAPGDYVRLAIQDTGCGIDPVVRERIFEPFFTTKGIGDGTGMGLAVAHGIVSDLGGAIAVDEAPQGGTTFTIHLPLSEAEDAADDVPAHEAPRGKEKERILLVDDEQAMVDVMGRGLRRLGYATEAYTSSFAALARFRNAPDAYDLAIVDQVMPMLNGRALAERMHSLNDAMPIIVCSGVVMEEDMAGSEGIGIRAFVQKPVDMGEMARLVRGLIDEESKEGQDHSTSTENM